MFNKVRRIVILALRNEISIDEYLCDKFGLNIDGIVYRPLRFGKINKLSNKFLSIVYLLLPIVIFALYIRACIMRIFTGGNVSHNAKSLFVTFSDKANSIYERYENHVDSIDLRNRNKLYQSLSIFDLTRAFFLSIIVLVDFYCAFKRKDILNAVHIYEVVCFLYFMDRASNHGVNEVLHANHYDRWAVSLSMCEFDNVVIYQHGIIDRSFNPCVMLKNVTKIFVYDELSEAYFLNCVLERNQKEIITGRISISSIKINDQYECFALIVGHPNYILDDLYIYNKLKSSNLGVIVYRPHPISRTSEVIRSFDCVSMSDDDFPNPSIVIVKESTLGFEYKSMGYEIYWWKDKEIIVNLILNGKVC